jgi:preprotein translocase subunit SecG
VIGGVKKTGDFLDKSTWTLATALVVLILLSNVALKSNYQEAESKILQQEGVESVPETLPEEIPEELPSQGSSPLDTLK